MDYYFITGSSKGLGKSIAELVLKRGNTIVFGLARTASIEHENYKHISIDLSDLDQVQAYQFPQLDGADRIILLNNAGMLGDVKRVGKIDNQQLIDCYNLNLISPTILTNNFISEYSGEVNRKIVLNISSGAGRNPIDGWSTYCSTKAGLDMFSRVLAEEITIDNSNVKILSLAPGIIDTDMQTQIRKSDNLDFSSIDRFRDYKEEGNLVHPDETAKQILRFIFEEDLSVNPICSVRDILD